MNNVNLNQNAVDVDIDDLEKAAILLLSMGTEAAAKVMQKLSRDEVQRLISKMAGLPGVSSMEARWTLQQFFNQYREQSGIGSASREYLEQTLDLALGQSLSRSLLDSLYGDVMSQDIQRLQWVPADVLARFFRNEHPQMQAVLLAFLPPQTASAVLDALPGSVHDDLLVRVAGLSTVSEHVLGELRLTLERCLAYVADQAGAKVNGVRQVADILNRYQGNKEQMLSLLREHDGEMAIEIEKNMFDFMALRRQSDETLQRLVQELPSELLALALKNTEASFRKVVLGAMPKRMAQALDDQIQNQGSVSLRKVEQARTEVMQLVRELVEQGEIEFMLFEEPTVS
ncbi:lateral flagellar motor switch protein FliGL [Aeromonas enteropelogenes]|uniref:Flagellar motor switch protein FliG n=2 Tax=Aeromonas TaxID=642 RepID=A0A175VGN6_AEREN|nr:MULTISPECIES: lateral flagellar motor switch protein FliGL [Aeromonas]KXU79791.1 flagellar motor switch protein G [Aeromonas enteropelogenes]MBL0458096.1 lateral flagellar motor switch protein FliGL [Aeromonas enteropelogenes]MBL0521827.1 lateral flagellar motor switch protein FliGL [Aeromonas enteropelogenes]MCZ0752098.1 lateral flagellar motor switch protein FliGL [Aeromonas enteropelogenes]QXC35272.1 lateral flagellar motor switch protein FliGL [Aeromonas sp. FDAARGOS 1407]